MSSRKPPLYDMSTCLLCRSPYVQWHHVYPSARRNASDREGCIAPLCYEHHQGISGVHRNRRFDLWLKAETQRRWMAREHATIEDFRAVFDANYLEDEE